MRIDFAEAEFEGAKIRKCEIGENDIGNLLEQIKYGRGTRPGTYTQLIVDGQLWMSDTDAECSDHLPVLGAVRISRAKRVLINGLGLGVVLTGVLSFDHVEHIDVVEIDPRVIKLIGPHFAGDDRVNLITADAYAQSKAWPVGTRWDVVWHDIWPDINAGNLDGMKRLHRSYGKRCGWQGSWSRPQIEATLRRERAESRAWGAFFS
jgi:hypothetical protein